MGNRKGAGPAVLEQEGRLGRFEFRMMNNPLKRWRQKHWEFALFLGMLEHWRIDLQGKAIMDAGCGDGFSTELIVKRFAPSHVAAFDLMPEQIRLAERRKLGVRFRVGDARQVDATDSSFDAVFVFAILHHIPQWDTALSEMARVLKPSGAFLLEEPNHNWLEWSELEMGIERAGLTILEKKGWALGIFRSYLCQKR